MAKVTILALTDLKAQQKTLCLYLLLLWPSHFRVGGSEEGRH